MTANACRINCTHAVNPTYCFAIAKWQEERGDSTGWRPAKEKRWKEMTPVILATPPPTQSNQRKAPPPTTAEDPSVTERDEGLIDG